MSNPPEPPPEDGIAVAVTDQFSVARINGRGSFKISSSLKKFGSSVAERGQGPLIVDLEKCIGLDSTFMGVLAGLSFKFKQLQGPRLMLVHLSDKNLKLISVLGLNHLVEVLPADQTPTEYRTFLDEGDVLRPLDKTSEDRQETARMMLEAHENLVEINEENRPKFQDVLIYLREELGESESS